MGCLVTPLSSTNLVGNVQIHRMCLGVSVFCLILETWMQVMYETSGFLEKNRDLLHADLLQLLASCDSFLPQLFAASIGEGSQKVPTPTRRVNGTESQKQSVAAKFKVWAYIFGVNFFIGCFSSLKLDRKYNLWFDWFCNVLSIRLPLHAMFSLLFRVLTDSSGFTATNNGWCCRDNLTSWCKD